MILGAPSTTRTCCDLTPTWGHADVPVCSSFHGRCALQGQPAVRSHCWLEAIQTHFPGHMHPSAFFPGLPCTWDHAWILGQERGSSTARKMHQISHMVHEAEDGDIHDPPWRKSDFIIFFPLSKSEPIPSVADGAAILQEERERSEDNPSTISIFLLNATGARWVVMGLARRNKGISNPP